MFIDRKMELEQMDRMYNSTRAEMFVLYGRRRVGKTELLRAFCQAKPNIFFIATLSGDQEQLGSFSRQIYSFTRSVVPDKFTYPSWEDAFRALGAIPMDPRPVVVLDEFSYLISANKGIPSILQKVWDEQLVNTRLMLVLCSSYIGMMEKEVLGYRSALYGRRTGLALLRPLDLPSSALFFPNYSPDERFLTWTVLGGMPYYLNTFSVEFDLYSNIQKHILNPMSGTLFNEPRLLLMEELREPRNYFSILRAIAQGHTRMGEIAQASGVGDPNTISRYLDTLQQMRLVTRRVPATETQPEKSKKGLFQIDDHFLRFWFRYIHPNQSSLELGLADAILEQRIKPDLDHFASVSFEEASRVYVSRLAQLGRLELLPERIGAWWDREVEIDVLAINLTEGTAIAGECKWSINQVGTNILDNLKKKTFALQRTVNLSTIHFAIFSRSGFTPALKAQAKAERVKLFTVEDLIDSE